MTINEQLAEFNAFAHELAQQMGGDLTLDEVYDQWWSDHHRSEDLAALKEAHAEYQRGNQGTPASKVLLQLTDGQGISSGSETE